MRQVLFAVVLCAVVVAASFNVDGPNLEHLQRDVESAHQMLVTHLNGFASQMAETPGAQHPNTQALSLQCTVALTQISAVWVNSTCAARRQAALNFTTADQSVMVAWCESDCKNLYLDAITTLSVACDADDKTLLWGAQAALFIDQFRSVVFLARGLCSNIAGTYCWPKLRALQAVATASAGPAGVTATDLDGVCLDSCVPLLLVDMNAFGIASLVATVKAYEIMCLNINGSYCVLEIKALAQNNATTVDATGRPNLPILCRPCIRGYLAKAAQLYAIFNPLAINPFVITFRVFNTYCVRAADGDFCINKFIAKASVLPGGNVACAGLSIGTCSTACNNYVTNAKNQLGCCFGTALQIAFPIASDTIVNAVSNQCGVNIQSCSPIRVRARIAIRNFLIAYVAAHQDQVIALLKADLALKLGVDVATMNITDWVDASSTSATGFHTMGTSPGVDFGVTISGGTPSDLNAIAVNVNTQLTSDNSFPSMNTLGLDSRQDSTQAVAADSTSSSASTEADPAYSYGSTGMTGGTSPSSSAVNEAHRHTSMMCSLVAGVVATVAVTA